MTNNHSVSPPTPTPTPTQLSAQPEIWLTGAAGMLGRQIAEELAHCNIAFIGTDAEVNIADSKVVMNFMARHRFKRIINCAAYTAVDRAENEPDIAMAVNGTAPGILGEAAARRGTRVIHISTDYVFDGLSNKPYREIDAPNPVSVYGQTKLAGESALTEACKTAAIIRISWLYGIYGRNFVETMLNLLNEKEEIRVVADQLGAPTYAGRLARNIVDLIEREDLPQGIYHYQDKGRISWYGFAREIQKKGLIRGILTKKCRIMPVTTEEFITVAKRPAFSVLNTEKLQKTLNFVVADWKENLLQYFEERKEIRR
ncbi:MAG: dTDP-4-dehydrorhamnose reductase [Acidobacteria bacterium]|nr:dTDP-4-dehydrorhamnose reductase [Acidobacteriota bacterium]